MQKLSPPRFTGELILKNHSPNSHFYFHPHSCAIAQKGTTNPSLKRKKENETTLPPVNGVTHATRSTLEYAGPLTAKFYPRRHQNRCKARDINYPYREPVFQSPLNCQVPRLFPPCPQAPRGASSVNGGCSTLPASRAGLGVGGALAQDRENKRIFN